MSYPRYCPSCNADLRGEPIPEEYKHHYGTSTHLNRAIGIYSMEEDRTIKWKCPDCDHTWEREYGYARREV